MLMDVVEKAYHAQYAKHAQRLIDAANKRLRRMEQAKIFSPAYYSAMKEGYFSGKGISKNWNQLMHEYNRVINFLNMETSTLGGARKYEKKIQNLLGGGEVSITQRELVFEIFNRMKELDILGVELFGSDKLISYISSNVSSDLINSDNEIDNEEYIHIIEENLQKAKEEIVKQYEEMTKNLKENLVSAFRKIK